MRKILIGLITAASCACTTTVVPVVKEAPKCAPAAAMLAACGDPAAIKRGITFGEMIDLSGRDRNTLRECALRHQALASEIRTCNEIVERYNADIREMNARNAANK